MPLIHYLDGTQYGFTASAKDNGAYKLVRITDINDGAVNWQTVPLCDCESSANYLLRNNDILVARTGGTTGKSFLVNAPPDNAIYASYLIRLRVSEGVNPLFVHAFLNSYSYWGQIAEAKAGAAQPNVNAEKLKKLLVPDCPLEVQNQVVNLLSGQQVDTWADISQHITSTLKQFNYIKSLEAELNTQQTLLAQLRQAILQEAVQGKLTAHWRQENPQTRTGADLLARIRTEKADLIRQGKLRKEKPLPPITEAEKPFELPEGWVWCKLGEVTNFIDYRGKTPNKVNEGIKLITAKNVKFGHFSEDPEEFITSKDYTSFMTRGIPRNGDILFTTEAPLGNACLLNYDNKFGLAQRIITIQPLILNSKYLLDCILSIVVQKQLKEKSSGVTATGIKSSKLITVSLPLPPLAEQQAIVAQVEQLLGQVSALETENKQQQAEVGRLMQAVLREAFVGGETVEN